MQRFYKILVAPLYRIWFYLLAAIPIILFFPLLLLFTLRESWYPKFIWVARNLWARPILFGMGYPVKIYNKQRLEKRKSYMLVANHTSIIDIMLMLVVCPFPFVFVGKKELVKIPLFGFFYKRVCIMVDRENSASRTGVYRRAQKRLAQGLSICIFPEGGVPEEHVVLDTFKDGAFKMAIAHEIPVVPFTFYNVKQHFSFTFFSGKPGLLRVKMHSLFPTAHLTVKDKNVLRDEVRQLLLQDLLDYETKRNRKR